jgi:mycothiol synthase
MPSDPQPASAALTWQPLSDDLVEVWHPLRAALQLADGHPEFLTLEDLRDELSLGWLDLGRDTVIGLDAFGVARAFGTVELRSSDRTLLRVNCLGGVHPAARGRGIGRALLDWQLARARQLATARREDLGEHVPANLRIELPHSAASAAALFTHAGLSVQQTSLLMRAPLDDEVTRVPPPDGLTIAPFSPELDEQMMTAHNTAFLGVRGFQPWSADTWRTWATGHRSFRPDWTYLALARGEVTGYVLCQAFPDEWPSLGWSQGYIAKLGILPAWRGRGLGRSLLSWVMAAFAADGMQYAGLDVDSGNTPAERLYASMGFEEWHRMVLWELPL